MQGTKAWNIKISIPQIVLFRGSIEYFSYISGHKFFFYFVHENGNVL